MKTMICITAVLFGSMPVLVSAEPQTTVEQRDTSTPKPETPTWETERDLLVLMDDAADRTALALQIRGLCTVFPTTLSAQQRFDGLKIAGHTLYREGEFAEAEPCFTAIVAMQFSDDATADSWRMLGQIAGILGDDPLSLSYYTQSYDLSLLMHADGEDTNLTAIVILPMIRAALNIGSNQLALDHADEALAMFAGTPHEQTIRPAALGLALEAALAIPDADLAEGYLQTLVTENPDFGMDRLDGQRPTLEIRLAEARGHDLSACDPDALLVAAAVLENEAYVGMVSWMTIAEAIANCFDQAGDIEYSNKLRGKIIGQVDTVLEDTTLEPKLRRSLRHMQGLMLSNGAVMYATEAGMEHLAIPWRTRLVAEFADVQPLLASRAAEKLAEIDPVAP